MMGRYVQLFMLASMVLLFPTLFYLSRQHQDYSIVKDYSLIQTLQSYKEHEKNWKEIQKQQQEQQQKQGTQGHGPPPALDPKIAQAWKWTDVWQNWNKVGSSNDPAKVVPTTVADLETTGATGGAIMPKMENATAKAELGRATWRFLHTMTLRFPEKPTDSDRETLLRFFHDFSRLYPCGECATHFQQLLKELPPQTSSRMSAALWLCSAHNKVNERLGKSEFPCDKLDETYDCGCGDDLKKSISDGTPAPTNIAAS